MTTGLFVGLITLDVIYLIPQLPTANQKLVARDYTIAAGGPATNAAITFQYLEQNPRSNSRLIGVLGCHALSQIVLADLQQRAIDLIDLDPDSADPIPTSSILVTEATGDRAVVSLNAMRSQIPADRLDPYPLDTLLQGIEVVLIDGHQMAISHKIAQQARAQRIPVVIDAGSWKPGFETVLPLADYVICSANFYPPHCTTQADLFAYLQQLGVPHIAVTHGAAPIEFCCSAQPNSIERGQVPVPQHSVIDTVGAGDIFHGAFCHFRRQADFPTALHQAAQVAAYSCRSFGTRAWMSKG
ncbi:MAG: PfkB family carbohydrate kinase [Elainella sp. Prado103]|nr:PfkB family carbohydrate kinase [Elainella sp. Prado103]